MKFRKRTSTLIILLLCLASAKAGDFLFKHLGYEQLLAGSRVNAICKGSDGFIWIGTSTGLSRYDGVTIQNFVSDFATATALPDNYIESIQEDASGRLWIKTGGSYVAMDTRTETFERKSSQLLSSMANSIEPHIIFVDRNRNLWVYDGATLYYNKISQELVYSFAQKGDNPVLPEGNITGLADTPTGIVAVYSSGLVASINTEEQQVEWINNIISLNMTTEDRYRIFSDRSQNLWVYGDRHFFYYDRSRRTWMRSLSELATQTGSSIPVSDDLLTGISQDSNGQIWLSTDRNGLYIFSTQENRFVQHLTAGADNRSLPSNDLQTVFVDDCDVVWVGSQHYGLSYWAPTLYVFDTDAVGDVSGISADRHGNVWMATRNHGLFCQQKDGTLHGSYGRSAGLCDDIFNCCLTADDGSVWVGSNRYGISHMQGSNVTTYNTSNGLQDDCIQALAQDLYGNVWIGTKRGGLQCLGTNGTFSNYNVANGKLSNNFVSCIFTQKNTLVAGTVDGVVVINLSNGETVSYNGNSSGEQHFTSNTITSVCQDSRGLLWVGTAEGLNLLDRSSDQLTSFTDECYGLLSGTITGIAEDSRHDIWVTTNKGVCRISLTRDKKHTRQYQYALVSYDTRDGLQGREFNLGAICATPDGNVYMGGKAGISRMCHSERNAGEQPLHIMLSTLKVNGIDVRPGQQVGGRTLLEGIINDVKQLTLRHDEGDLTIQLAVSDYAHAEHPRFTYMLDGDKETDWAPVLYDGRTIRLSGLQPGSYTLHIRGSLDHGRTIAEERTLNIVVRNAWYRSWWSYLILAVLAAGIVFLIRYFVTPIVRVVRERRTAIKEYRERKELLENIANEIRQEVVHMNPQLGLMKLEVRDPEMKEKLDDMQHTIRQFLEKLNQLREDRSLKISEAGMDSDADFILTDDDAKGAPADEDLLLISDDGVVQGSGMLSETGEITDIPTAHCRVFILEKDPDMLEFMADCLKGNYTLRTFTDINTAWEAILAEKPDLIMCAHDMNGGSGSELCNRVKSLRDMEQTPFIITTEGMQNAQDIIQNRITLMADDYIPQPMNLQVAILRINRLLGVEIPGMEDIAEEETMQLADSMALAVKLQLRQQVYDYVVQNISRKDLSIEELSRAMDISRTLLFRKIENVTGRTPADYIRAVRMQEASKLLSSGALSVGEIATALGFANTQSFSYYFNQEYGVLPTEYADIINMGEDNDGGPTQH